VRHSGYDRADDDWYQEPAWLVDALLDREDFHDGVWDPAAGAGTIPKACLARGITAIGSDIADRGFGCSGLDFFSVSAPTNVAILSNPPYSLCREFISHALSITSGKVCVLARLAFLESRVRRPWFEASPLARVWVSSRRVSMPPGGKAVVAKGGSIAFAFFVFQNGHVGAPSLGWLA
jgi:hypothetical protein